MKKTRIHVLTVDDNRIQASGLIPLFQNCESINYRGNVSSPEECIKRVINDKMIDIILMDVKFPNSEMDGIQLARKLRTLQPFSEDAEQATAPRIIFFSVETLGFVDKKNGIHGLIPKHEDFSNIVKMIEMIHKYGAIFPPKKLPEAKPDFWEKLSQREKEVFKLVLQGKKTNEIAKQLGFAPITGNEHRKKILRKIKASGIEVDKIDDPRLVKLVLRYKLFDIESLRIKA